VKLPLLLVGSLVASLLYSETLTVEGIWNGGGTEVYIQGNEHYCFKPTDGSSAIFKLNAKKRNLDSCIYLTLGAVVASTCGNDPTLEVQSLSEELYKIIVAPVKSAKNVKYILDVSYNGQFGRCSDYYQAGYLGMSKEQINFILALSGLFTALGFFGSITYVILTLGNF